MRRVHVFRQRNLCCSALVYSYITPTGRDACAFRKRPGQLVEKTRKINECIYIYFLKKSSHTPNGSRSTSACRGSRDRDVAKTRCPDAANSLYIHTRTTYIQTHITLCTCIIGRCTAPFDSRANTHTRSTRLYFGSEPSPRSARACCSVFSFYYVLYTFYFVFPADPLAYSTHPRTSRITTTLMAPF